MPLSSVAIAVNGNLLAGQVERWSKTATDGNANGVITMAEQRDLEKHRQQDQKQIKAKNRIYAVRKKVLKRQQD